MQFENIINGTTVPEPFLYLAWKHHLVFVNQIINKHKGTLNKEQIRLLCNKFGGSVLDFYFGLEEPSDVVQEIQLILTTRGINSHEQYQNWLDSIQGRYRTLTLADGTSWTLRMGNIPKRYIHIHPSRHSAETVRVRATVLKSAVAFRLYFPDYDGEPPVELVNKARKEVLDLPPLKEDVIYHPFLRMFRYLEL